MLRKKESVLRSLYILNAMEKEFISLAFVEDDAVLRESMAAFLSEFSDMELKFLFSKGEDAVEKLSLSPVDVVLMDIHLPGKSGIGCVRELKAAWPQMQFLMCTSFDEPVKIFESLKAGANGYVLKSSAPEKLREAILDIHRGGSPMSPQIARMVVSSFSGTEKPDAVLKSLSSREQEILEYLSKGYQYREIAEKLSLSTETVRSHLRRIYEKLQVRSGVEAINRVFPRG